ncbi:MAG: hypothetical protein QOG31_931, partial [Thermoplasmata archaeon]|nr:hypothetical protein [Thermoplasmata archaeon]
MWDGPALASVRAPWLLAALLALPAAQATLTLN